MNGRKKSTAIKSANYGKIMTRRNWMQMEVNTKANELIETVLKPKYLQPPPENPQFNYIVDIYGKWYHKAFYFCAEYRVAGPNTIEPGFEAQFARMQYAGK